MRSLTSFFLVTLLLLFQGCSGISMISPQDVKDLYTDKFLLDIGSIKEQYRQGRYEMALVNLQKIDGNKLLPSERSLRRNLIGVIYFSKEQFEQAIYHFELAMVTAGLDRSLNAQIKLNLASSYFKLGFMDKAFSITEGDDYKNLKSKEKKKFQLLRYKTSKELGKSYAALISLGRYLEDLSNLDDLRNEPNFGYLRQEFLEIGKNQKIRFLEEFDEKRPLVTGYLGYLQAEKLYYQGDNHEAEDLIDWIKEKYENQAELIGLVQDFSFRRENYSKMDPNAIGVILPLSGKNKIFGQRALLGIDHALKQLQERMGVDKLPYKLIIKDSKNSPTVGAYWVKELIENNHVSTIIGGLFSSESSQEFLEAKKNGVLFISLDQVFLSRDQKDHLLLEIPGSVESQINELFSERILNEYGKNVAILYPYGQRGQAYVDEFWRRANIHDVNVTDALSFERSQTDYREDIKNVLGLKYKRSRSEEVEIYKEIQGLEKLSSIRRIQVLNPQIDFDWIFIPAFPNEALQIVPSFTYYDAFRVKIFGGPSWRSKALSRESYKLGALHFIGDDVTGQARTFQEDFYRSYQKFPKLIEMRGYDALNIAHSILSSEDFNKREAFDRYIQSKEKLVGITGTWNLKEKLWLKDLSALRLHKGKVKKIFEDQEN